MFVSRTSVVTLHDVSVNRLAAATSPYLLQHADNPVAWFEWGPEALAKAAEEDKPLFLSIGYAACHWCHVMAHESFENEEIAELLNRSFVAIKIDREERPDLDQLYMSACQAATGHGGWPLSVFATPEGRPFFAGTYFPPVDRGGQPSFPRVLLALEDAWANKRTEVEEQASALTAAVENEASFADTLAEQLPSDALDFDRSLGALVAALTERFDAQAGGFGGAPKFPRPSYVEACLVHYQRTSDPASLAMARTTLDAMAAGGIYDHLAGGFARYSVDDQWLVPHFEKMLTDQALLARCYLHAFQLTGDAHYKAVVTETLDWVLDALTCPNGGLASSVDADAAGEEGSHAVFTPHDVAEALRNVPGVLSPEDACDFYNITAEGTFEHGASVVARTRFSNLLRNDTQERTRAALLEARAARPQPGIDDKIIVEWNAMTASVLAEAAAVLANDRWAEAARRIVRVLDRDFRLPSGRLSRSGRQGTLTHLAMLADHAWLLEACTRLYELDADDSWLERAEAIAAELCELFFDGTLPTTLEPAQGSGFFTTGHDAEVLLARNKDVFDSALPSATSVAITGLARLSALQGSTEHSVVADRTVTLLGAAIERHPMAVPDLILSLGWLRACRELAIPGIPGELLGAARSVFAPFVVFTHGESQTNPLLLGRSEGWAYLCENQFCQRPVQTPAEVVAQLLAAVPS